MKRHLIGIAIFILALIVSYNLIWYFDRCNHPAVICCEWTVPYDES